MRRFLACSTLLATAAASGQVSWLNPVNGNWSDSTKWTAGNVPDNGAEVADISVAGTYAVEFNGNFNFGGLTLTNANATLNVQPNLTLGLGGNITNNGLVLVNSTGVASGTSFRCDSPAQMFAGTGTLRLNADASNLDTAQMNPFNGTYVITNSPSHRIKGTGRIRTQLNNQGLIEADISGRTLEIAQINKANAGTMRAIGGGAFSISGITVNNAGGLIVADGANSVVNVASSGVNDGTMRSINGGISRTWNSTYSGVTFEGPHHAMDNATFAIAGSGITNNGSITLNPGAVNSATVMRVDAAAVTLGGSGALHLNANPANLDTAQMSPLNGTFVLTNGSGHTIDGIGRIRTALVNDGVIRADGATDFIEFHQIGKTNNATIEAVNGGVIQLNGIGMTNSATGVIRADGGGSVASYVSSNVSGGTLQATNGGVGSISNSGFSDLTMQGPHQVNANTAMNLNAAITNNGTITVNPTATNSATYLQTNAASTPIGGSGTVRLNTHPSNPDTAQMNPINGTFVLTIGTNQTVSGTGSIRTQTINNGVIDATDASLTLALRQFGKTNNGTMRASNGGVLSIEGIGVTNNGQIRAEGAGSVVSYNGNSTIVGGQLVAANGGVGSISNANFNNATFSGPHQLNANTALNINGTITNNGTLTVNPTAANTGTYLQTNAAAATIDGSGTVRLNAHASNPDTAQMNTINGNFVLTIGPSQTVSGTGAIRVNTVNNGLIDATDAGLPLALRQFGKTNNGTMRATNGGVLSFEGVNVTNNGQIRADGAGSVVSYGGGSFSGGQLIAAGGGIGSIGNAAFADTTFSGPHQVSANTVLNLNGAITNNGTLTVNPNAVNSGTYLQTNVDGASIGGSGTVLLNANLANLDTAQMNPTNGLFVLTVGPDQTIAGNGAIRTQTTLQGTLSPGLSAGAIGRIEQRQFNMSMSPSAELEVDLNGLAAGQFDTVGYAGSVALDGTLRVHLAAGFNPVQGDEFVILTAASRTGTFEQIVSPNPGPNNAWRVRYEPTRAVLTVTCPPDIDGDHTVTLSDLAQLLAHFGVTSGASGQDGDIDGDGDVELQDLATLLATFGTTCP